MFALIGFFLMHYSLVNDAHGPIMGQAETPCNKNAM